MHRLLHISRSPDEFARLSRRAPIGAIVGFVSVVVVMLGQTVLHG